MSLAEDDVLFGRIALHYKLVTPDQLNEAAARQVQEGAARRLSDLLVDSGVLSAVQLQKLLAVQQDYIAKREAAAQPAAVPAVSPSLPVPQATPMPPIVEAEPVYVPEPEPASRPLPQGPPLFRWREAKRRLDAILEYAVERNASDIHVHSAAPLKMRINGRLQEIEEEVLDRDLAAAVLGEVLTPEQKSILDTLGQVDLAAAVSAATPTASSAAPTRSSAPSRRSRPPWLPSASPRPSPASPTSTRGWC
jgi:cell division septation protein DedD